MQVTEALKARKSTRAFLPTEVSRESITRILSAARHAPSGTNLQPWQVAVVTGDKLRDLTQKLEQAFRAGKKEDMDYQYYPMKWQEPYRSRRKACGLQMYQTLGIKREDKERQIDQWAANFRSFDAPAMLLFFMAPVLETGSYLDYGMFLQSIMLAAVEEGLATCPQASLGEYPELVKHELDYPPDSILIGGMALGYEDPDALVNSYRTPREEVETFTRFFS
jgi:nitroreductase